MRARCWRSRSWRPGLAELESDGPYPGATDLGSLEGQGDNSDDLWANDGSRQTSWVQCPPAKAAHGGGFHVAADAGDAAARAIQVAVSEPTQIQNGAVVYEPIDGNAAFDPVEGGQVRTAPASLASCRPMPARTTRRRFIRDAGAGGVALAGLPAVARAQRGRPHDGPNVVLIIVDTLRADHVFGKRARTPNIDALAREGLSFTRCFPEAMPTIPARRSILSGRRTFPFRGWHPYPGLLGEPGWAPLQRPAISFTTALKRAGYWTAYVTDNTGVGFSPPWAAYRRSLDRFERRGGQYGGISTGVSEAELRHWLPPAIEDAETRDRVRRYLANGRYSHDETKSFAARVFKDAAGVLEAGARRREPFALVVDTFEPHEPWTPPRRYVDMYGDPDYRGPEPARPYYAPVSRYLSGSELVLVDRMKALYAAEVTMTDRWLGVFLERLHELRLERETAIVLVSDHGFFLGDHGLTGKIATRLHPELIHVPLIVVDPQRRLAGRTRRWFASTHDIAPTLLSMAGVPVPRAMDGVDLSRFFDGRRPPERAYAWGGYGNSFFVRTDRWKAFGHNRGGDLHLYDPRRDRRETRDLSGSNPAKALELLGAVRGRAGGQLPYYPGTI